MSIHASLPTGYNGTPYTAIPADAGSIVSIPEWIIVQEGDNVVLDQPLRVTVTGGVAVIYGPPADSDQPPTRVFVSGDGKVTTYGRVDVLATDSSSVTAFGEYTVHLTGDAQGTVYNRGKWMARDRANITCHDSTTGSAYNTATVTLRNSASAWITDMTQALVSSEYAEVIAHHNALVQILATWLETPDPSDRRPTVTTHEVATVQIAFTDATAREVRERELAALQTRHARVLVAGDPLPPVRGYQTGGSPAEDEALAAATSQNASPSAGVGELPSIVVTPSDPLAPPLASAAPPAPAAFAPPAPAPTAPPAAPAAALPSEYFLTGTPSAATQVAGSGGSAIASAAPGKSAPPISPYNADTAESIFGSGIDPSGAEVPWRPIQGGVPIDPAKPTTHFDF